ncbi:hypothetical protein NL405_27980, partial [Klebsiella pneumoniae]|nr:hypothetical protein [Klebsiella pneumoniae]
ARTVQQLDQTTLALAHYWKLSKGSLRLQDQAGEGIYPEVDGFSAAIFNKDGKLLTSLRGKTASADISARAYFQAHRDRRVRGL